MPSDSIVRKAVPEDRESIWELFRLLHEENGVFPISEPKINHLLDRTLYPERILEADTGLRGFMGVIGSVGKLEGLLVIVLGSFWYSDDIIFEEYANFVHPDHRKSNHAKALLAYSRHMADSVSIPLCIGIVSNVRTAAKVRLYRRQLPEAGNFFLYGVKKHEAH
jgi:GNAT superfamily N-acetyltransferase